MEDQASKLRTMVSGNSLSDKIKVISIISGENNFGKTNLAINLAIEYKLMSQKVLLFDTNKDAENMKSILDIHDLTQVDIPLKEDTYFEDLVLMGPGDLDIILRGDKLTRVNSYSLKRKSNFLSKLRSINRYDTIIIDNKAGINSEMLAFLNFSNDVVLIVNTSLDSILDSYEILKLFAKYRIRKSLKIVVTKAIDENDGRRVFSILSQITNNNENFKLEYLGIVRLDKNVAKLNNAKIPIILNKEPTGAGEDIEKVFQKLLSSENYNNKAFSIDEIIDRLEEFFK